MDPSMPTANAQDAVADEETAAPSPGLELDLIEARILGVLIEKEMSTPENYPLTLNSLRIGCNQKSNRAPVVDMDEYTAANGLERLRDKGMARSISGADMRVPKHYHRLDEVLSLGKDTLAVLCELLLRGPQTVGELRGRCNRLHPFEDLSSVEAVLGKLGARPTGPLVKKLPRQPGRKEPRHAHLLCGEPEVADAAEVGEERVEAAVIAVRADSERLERLEAEVQTLKAELEVVRAELARFKQQFE
jgi:uncharacterized protein